MIGRHTKKTSKFQKKGFALEPRYVGMFTFSTKILRHWRMQFETPACTILFFYQDTLRDLRLIQIHFHAISPYGRSAKYLAVVPYYTPVTLWHILVNKLVSLTPQTNNTCRKLRVSAFQWYKGWGVADRVFLSKSSMACTTSHWVFSGFWGDLELWPLFEKYGSWGDSYVRSTERKSLPVLKTPRTLQSQLNNGFCQQRWANYCLAVLVQPTYVHTCGTSTVNLANLVFFGASNAKILAFDRAHREISNPKFY